MKHLWLLLLLAMPCSLALAQDSHVLRSYSKNTNVTLVTSDVLYVVNTPSQFIQLQMKGRYSNEGPPLSIPDKISIEFYSYTIAPLYLNDEARRLTIKTGDEVLDYGLMTYSAFRENGKSAFASTRNSKLLIQAPIPAIARVRSTNADQNLTLEAMAVTDMPLEKIGKLAQARQLFFEIGDTVIQLTPTQMGILREFAASITPAGGLVADGPDAVAKMAAVILDVPSDMNNASLGSTLKWLGKELPHAYAPDAIWVRGKIEVVPSTDCKFTYRFTPDFKDVPGSTRLTYTIVDHELDLADLNPESTRLSDVKKYAMLSFNARNLEPKIKIYTRHNENGLPGRVLKERAVSGISLNLRDLNSALRIKAALVHAMKLCHP